MSYVTPAAIEIIKTMAVLPEPWTYADVVAALDRNGTSHSIGTVRNLGGQLAKKRAIKSLHRGTVAAAAPYHRTSLFKHLFDGLLAQVVARQQMQAKTAEVLRLRTVACLSCFEIAKRLALAKSTVVDILRRAGSPRPGHSPSPSRRALHSPAEPLDPPTPHELAWRQFRSTELQLPEDNFYSKETFIT